MGFQQGLSGLNASSKALDAVGNNIANSGTAGFKAASARFADVFASSLGGGGGSQVGIGTSLSSVYQQFTQGNITTTNNPLDMAINGQGFFRLSNNGAVTYTRNGQFQLDKDGFIINAAGYQLTGYAADPTTGSVIPGNLVPLQVINSNIAPQVTSTSNIQVNLDSRATPPSAMSSGTLTGSAALGTATTITAGVNDTLNVSVDGVAASVTLPAGSYAIGTLTTTLQSAINTALTGTGASVSVSSDTSGNLVITSDSKGTVGSQGLGSSVALTGGNAATTLLGGAPVAVTGLDNFNPSTAGSLAGSQILGSTTTITAANNVINTTVDGTAVSVTIPANTYTPSSLASTLQGLINTALGAVPVNARVTASINASGQLVVTSNSLGASSTVALTGGSGAATLFGAASTSTPGGVNLAAVNPLGFTASTSQTIYDSLGNGHNLSLYFAKTSKGNEWQMYSTLDGGQQTGPTTVQFDGAGNLSTAMPVALPASNSSYTFTNGANALQFSLDLTGTTQYGIAFGVNQLTQDGFTSGRLSGISIGADGTVQGRYSNGKSRTMGQLVLSNFNNPSGLQSLGGNQWAETAQSGQPIPGAPGQGSLGVIQAAAIEESNTDLTAELVSMITQQRAYQANAQSIKTQDQILQTLVNLR
ncbi:MAG TPA: flagellar hook-basal body complex protein [Rhodocyclaceae bacterium]|nr:flagellar hook-basal body complex protein [Rhodocyclaceae bacterium]